jgi:protein gp37
MAQKTSIEWTESTWNPVTGCDPVSNGCDHCYAERLAFRLQAMGSRRYINGFKLTVHEDLFQVPLRWREPRVIFVNSMSDLFHESVPIDAIRQIFDTMNKASWHTFQVLTKRPMELLRHSDQLVWTPNIWIGVTVESSRYAHRIDALRMVPASIRFVSFEPLLSAIPASTSLKGIQWAIVGGESGPGARAMDSNWVAGLRALCRKNKTAFFFKQWGGVKKKAAGRLFQGRTYSEMPRLISSDHQETLIRTSDWTMSPL